jgi:hypothetical protein
MALGHQPVRFEEFSAQPYPSREACLRAVHESDVYLLLLGPHYGHVFPETGQSATHDEFVAAQAKGIPRIVLKKTGVGFEPARRMTRGRSPGSSGRNPCARLPRSSRSRKSADRGGRQAEAAGCDGLLRDDLDGSRSMPPTAPRAFRLVALTWRDCPWAAPSKFRASPSRVPGCPPSGRHVCP